MITDIALYLLALIMTLMFTISDTISSGWSVWPASFLSGLTYFFQLLMTFNFIFPIDTLFDVIKFIISFEVIYLGVKLLLKLFNYIRGASGIEI
jgi:hypothetical protein